MIRYQPFRPLFTASLLFLACTALPAGQNDTVYAFHVSALPVIDGIGNDACWTDATWQPVDQVWIPYGGIVDSSDLYARYKIAWSQTENLLYFLLEINDDIISDAYVPGFSSAIYNFDMFEVFIDEDKSGGYHVFDGNADNEESLGLNAENAFAYHIFTRFPESGYTSSEFRAEDLTGKGWDDRTPCNYVQHFPEFVMRREGNVSTWEFSLIVYNDSYTVSDPGNSRVSLFPGKILGLTLAINDDDEPEISPVLTVRDHFIGSVAVVKDAFNDHWKNARDFGTVMLVKEGP